ncbi:MAG: sigma-70 family RNA polymerase sigma factor [Leptospiraceae bacterium]|nr:sigma-70 family RNA polymerase sigma factor [Leptospiraceae bacterium]
MINAAELIEQHGDALYAYARTRLADDEDIADCIQETLLAALKNAGTFSGRSSERTWLIGILKFKIIDHYRAKAKEVRNQSVEADDEDYFGEDRHWEMSRAPRAWEKSPLESLEDRELQNYLYDCISRLPTTMKAAVVLRELEQQATGEICKQLEVSATNLNVILYRARMHLRACLETAGFRGVARG